MFIFSLFVAMLNPFEGMFFEKGPKRQGMEDLFGGGGGGYFATGSGTYTVLHWGSE